MSKRRIPPSIDPDLRLIDNYQQAIVDSHVARLESCGTDPVEIARQRAATEQLAVSIGEAQLPAALQPVAEFASLTGWRVQSEVLPLEWRHVDLKAGTVALDVGSTKNGEGRTIYVTAALRTLLEAQKAAA